MKFHRYGGLSAVSYPRDIAPVRKGIFAFPQGWSDTSFWAWRYKATRRKGVVTEDHRTFRFDGLLWSHLPNRLEDHRGVEGRSGDWCLIPAAQFQRLLGRMELIRRREGDFLRKHVDGYLLEVFIDRKNLSKVR